MNDKPESAETAKEGLRFAGVGIAATVTDFCVYAGLLFISLGTAPSKFLAAIAGITASYVGNRYFTFKSAKAAERRVLAFIALYGLTLLANVAVNEVMLNLLLRGVSYRIPGAFVVATCVSAGLNFIGLKYVVFKKQRA